MHNTTLFN